MINGENDGRSAVAIHPECPINWLRDEYLWTFVYPCVLNCGSRYATRKCGVGAKMGHRRSATTILYGIGKVYQVNSRGMLVTLCVLSTLRCGGLRDQIDA